MSQVSHGGRTLCSVIGVRWRSERGALVRLIGALLTAAVVVLGPHFAEVGAASVAPPAEPASAHTTGPATQPSLAQQGETSLLGGSTKVAGGTHAGAGDLNDLRSICVWFLFSVILSTVAVLVLRWFRTPRGATNWQHALATPTPLWLPQLEPDALGVSRT